MPWIGPVVGAGIGLIASDRAASKQAGAADRATALTQEQYAQSRQDLMPWMNTGNVALDKLKFLLGLPGAGSVPEMPTREQFTTGAQPITRRQETGGRGVPFYKDVITGYTPGAFDEAGYTDALAKWELAKQELEGNPEFGSLLEPFDLSKFEESPAYQFNLSEGMKAINKGAAGRGDYYAPATLRDLGTYAQGSASNEFQNALNNYNTNQENIWRRLYGVSESGRGAASGIGDLGARAAGSAAANTIGAGNAQAAGIIGGANAIAGGIGSAYNNYLQQQILGQMQSPTYGGRRAVSAGFETTY